MSSNIEILKLSFLVLMESKSNKSVNEIKVLLVCYYFFWLENRLLGQIKMFLKLNRFTIWIIFFKSRFEHPEDNSCCFVTRSDLFGWQEPKATTWVTTHWEWVTCTTTHWGQPQHHPDLPPESPMASGMMKLPMMMVAGCRSPLVGNRDLLEAANCGPKAEADANASGNADGDEDDWAGDTIMPPLIFWHDWFVWLTAHGDRRHQGEGPWSFVTGKGHFWWPRQPTTALSSDWPTYIAK